MINSFKKTLFWVIFAVFLFCLWPAFAADVPSSAIQDDSALRVSIKDTWLAGTPSAVLQNRAFVSSLPGGGPIQVRAEARNGEISVILARERNGSFPGWAQGSWIYTRNLNTGAPLRIRMFMRSDPQIYVQWRPFSSDKSQIDLVLYEAYIVRGLPIGVPFERLLTMPVEEILAMTGNRFPRRYFDPDPRLYRNTASFVSKVRAALPPLNYEDDGAIDESGAYILIDSLKRQTEPVGLNCSGFVKWVIDGILKPVTGKRLPVALLKAPVLPRASSLAANYKDRDPLFGLDWTRNLALETAKVLRSPAFAVLENVEVREAAFASLIDRTGGRVTIKSYPGFLMNTGFSMEGLRPLLYTLAINEPGYIYLASVNREDGSALPLRQHYHVAVLVPYFNEFGNFQILVFESAEETTFAGFLRRHPQGMVNLVRIPVEGVFEP